MAASILVTALAPKSATKTDLRSEDEPGSPPHARRRKREAAAEELAEYREIEKQITDDKRSYFGYATLRWGIAQARAWIRWSDAVLEELEAR